MKTNETIATKEVAGHYVNLDVNTKDVWRIVGAAGALDTGYTLSYEEAWKAFQDIDSAQRLRVVVFAAQYATLAV